MQRDGLEGVGLIAPFEDGHLYKQNEEEEEGGELEGPREGGKKGEVELTFASS